MEEPPHDCTHDARRHPARRHRRPGPRPTAPTSRSANWIDDHSRYCLGSIAAPVFTAHTIDGLFRALAAEHGDSAGVLSDNRAVFTGRYRGGGRVALEVTLHARGVVCSYCRPYHPQTCGKVERFRQTLKKWLARQPRTAAPAALEAQLDTFRGYYNDRRPHRALARRAPAETYSARPKAAASGVPLIDGHFRVRHDKIDATGKLTLRHNSRQHHIGIGRRHAGRPVLLLVHDLLRPRAQHQRTTTPRPATRPDPGLPTTGPNVNDVAGHL
jgi:hypothetical protein